MDKLTEYNSLITNTILAGYGIVYQYIQRREDSVNNPEDILSAYQCLNDVFCKSIPSHCPILNLATQTFEFVEDVHFHKVGKSNTEFEVTWVPTGYVVDMFEFSRRTLVECAKPIFEESYMSILIEHLTKGDMGQQMFSIMAMVRNIYSSIIFDWMAHVYGAIPESLQIDLTDKGNIYSLSCMINIWWEFITNTDTIVTLDVDSHLLPPSQPGRKRKNQERTATLHIHPVISVQKIPYSRYGFLLSIKPSKLRVKY